MYRQKIFAWDEYDNIYFNGTQITDLNTFVYQYIYEDDSTEYTREFEQYEKKVKEICHTLCMPKNGLLYGTDIQKLKKVKTELDQLISALNSLQKEELKNTPLEIDTKEALPLNENFEKLATEKPPLLIKLPHNQYRLLYESLKSFITECGRKNICVDSKLIHDYILKPNGEKYNIKSIQNLMHK